MSRIKPSTLETGEATTGSRDARVEESHPASPPGVAKGSSNWVILGLVLLTVLLYGQGLTRSRGYYGDSFHHLINGIFVHDAMHEPVLALSDPVGFALDYYMHYPAVNLGYYPPVFPIIMAFLMMVFGVSATTGQLAVLFMSIMMTVFAFAWFRLRFELPWAATATVLFISTPLLVYWGRDIMLEIPMMAMVMGAIWAFERLMRAERPTWPSAMTWTLFSVLAIWTKQHALLLLAIYAPTVVLTRRWRHFFHPSMILASIMICVAAVGLIRFQLRLGGDAVEHSVGTTTQQVAQRFNTDQWTYYLRNISEIVSWPALVLSPFGVYFALQKRERYLSMILVWPIMFYLMHSYFSVRNPRYGVLWVLPFCALAVIGLKHFAQWVPVFRERLWIPMVTACCISFYLATQVTVPEVPSAYQRAAEDLADRMGPYSCISYFPDRPGRAAVCYRLAVEERRNPERDIYSFGRILRAKQLHSASNGRWRESEEAAADFRQWNVKYILTEHPHVLERWNRDWRVTQMMYKILELGEFRAIRTYPVHYSTSLVSNRMVTLYERIAPLPLNENAAPVIRTKRIPTLISAEGSKAE